MEQRAQGHPRRRGEKSGGTLLPNLIGCQDPLSTSLAMTWESLSIHRTKIYGETLVLSLSFSSRSEFFSWSTLPQHKTGILHEMKEVSGHASQVVLVMRPIPIRITKSLNMVPPSSLNSSCVEVSCLFITKIIQLNLPFLNPQELFLLTDIFKVLLQIFLK